MQQMQPIFAAHLNPTLKNETCYNNISTDTLTEHETLTILSAHSLTSNVINITVIF